MASSIAWWWWCAPFDRWIVDAEVVDGDDEEGMEVDSGGLPFLRRGKTLAPEAWSQDSLIGQGAIYGGIGHVPNSGALPMPNFVTTNQTSQATYASAASVLQP